MRTKFLPTLLLTTTVFSSLPSHAVNSELTIAYGKAKLTETDTVNSTKLTEDGSQKLISGAIYFGDLDSSGPLLEQGFLSKQSNLSGQYAIYSNDRIPSTVYIRELGYKHILQDQFILGVEYNHLWETHSLKAGYYFLDNLAATLTYSKTSELDEFDFKTITLNLHSVLELGSEQWLAIDASLKRFEFVGETNSYANLKLSYYFNSHLSLSASYENNDSLIGAPNYAPFDGGDAYIVSGNYFVNNGVGLSLSILNSKSDIYFDQYRDKTKQTVASIHFRF